MACANACEYVPLIRIQPLLLLPLLLTAHFSPNHWSPKCSPLEKLDHASILYPFALSCSLLHSTRIHNANLLAISKLHSSFSSEHSWPLFLMQFSIVLPRHNHVKSYVQASPSLANLSTCFDQPSTTMKFR